MIREYKKHLSETFKDLDYKQLEKYVLLDIFKELKPMFTNSGFVFNGSFNLLINHNYLERELTSGFNFSAINMSFLSAQLKLEKMIFEFKNKWYELTITDIDKTNIESSNFPMIKLNINAKVKDSELRFNFTIDISLEELAFSETIINDNGFKYYSIERTLASKYVGAIANGAKNDREKDLIDIVFLFFIVKDYKTLYLISQDIIHKRKISIDQINRWLNNFSKWTSIWEIPQLDKVLKLLNDNVFPEVIQ